MMTVTDAQTGKLHSNYNTSLDTLLVEILVIGAFLSHVKHTTVVKYLI